METLNGELQQMLQPLFENNFLKEYRYQVTNVAEFERLYLSTESEFAKLYSQILSLEERILQEKMNDNSVSK